MQRFTENLLKYTILFSLGGISYLLIELIWRGYSHWTMFALGGVCFTLLGAVNRGLSREIPFISRALIGTAIITSSEFVTGCIVNLYLHLDVWSYSNMPLNLMGQICVPYMLLWLILSSVCLVADNYLRFMFFGEDKPQYRLF